MKVTRFWNVEILSFICGLLVTFCCFSPKAALCQEKSSVSDAQKLERTITLERTGITLEDLMHSLSSRDLTLTCDRECAPQKLQLRVKQRSLKELMGALADLLPGTWEPLKDKSGYILQMRSQAIYDRVRWWDLYLEARQHALQPIIQALLVAMRTPPEQSANSNQEDSSLPHAPSPADEQEFYFNLPAGLQQAIAERIDDMASYTNEGLVSDDDEGALLVKITDLPPKVQEVLRRQNPNLPADSFVRFTNDGTQVQANFINSQGKYVVSTLVAVNRSPAAMVITGLDQSILVRLDQANRLKRAPSFLRELADYQKKTFWKNELPQDKKHRFPPFRRSDVLSDIAESANIEFVADYYSQPGVPLPPQAHPQPLAHPLADELNQKAAEYDMSWKKQGDLYLFRDNRWYRDDRLEVPASQAKAWLTQWTADQERLNKENASQSVRFKDELDWTAAFVSKLTRWQLTNGLMWLASDEGTDNTQPKADSPQAQAPAPSSSPYALYPFYQLAEKANREYHFLHFYASLSPQARTALCEQHLPLASLAPAQEQEALWLSPLLRIALDKTPPARIALGVGLKGDFNAKLGLVFSTPDKASIGGSNGAGPTITGDSFQAGN